MVRTRSSFQSSSTVKKGAPSNKDNETISKGKKKVSTAGKGKRPLRLAKLQLEIRLLKVCNELITFSFLIG